MAAGWQLGFSHMALGLSAPEMPKMPSLIAARSDSSMAHLLSPPLRQGWRLGVPLADEVPDPSCGRLPVCARSQAKSR